MCDICRQSPCHPRCPNTPGLIPVFICSGCGEDIYEGEDVYHLLGEQYCERCIEESTRVADEDLICFLYDEVIHEGEEYFEIMDKVICAQCVDDAREEAMFEFDEEYHFDL